MKRTARLRSAIFALGMSLLLWGCEGVGDPAQLLSPSEASYGKGGNSGRLKLGDSSDSQVAVSRVYYKVIDQEGGDLGDAAYRIVVPPNAVSGPTLFVIGSTSFQGSIVLKATASTCLSGEAELCYDPDAEQSNDIGGPGFKKPVEIFLGFNAGGGRKAWSGVSIVWIRPDGEFVRIPTNVRMAQKELRGITDHFSLYGIGWP